MLRIINSTRDSSEFVCQPDVLFPGEQPLKIIDSSIRDYAGRIGIIIEMFKHVREVKIEYSLDKECRVVQAGWRHQELAYLQGLLNQARSEIPKLETDFIKSGLPINIFDRLSERISELVPSFEDHSVYHNYDNRSDYVLEREDVFPAVGVVVVKAPPKKEILAAIQKLNDAFTKLFKTIDIPRDLRFFKNLYQGSIEGDIPAERKAIIHQFVLYSNQKKLPLELSEMVFMQFVRAMGELEINLDEYTKLVKYNDLLCEIKQFNDVLQDHAYRDSLFYHMALLTHNRLLKEPLKQHSQDLSIFISNALKLVNAVLGRNQEIQTERKLLLEKFAILRGVNFFSRSNFIEQLEYNILNSCVDQRSFESYFNPTSDKYISMVLISLLDSYKCVLNVSKSLEENLPNWKSLENTYPLSADVREFVAVASEEKEPEDSPTEQMILLAIGAFNDTCVAFKLDDMAIDGLKASLSSFKSEMTIMRDEIIAQIVQYSKTHDMFAPNYPATIAFARACNKMNTHLKYLENLDKAIQKPPNHSQCVLL